MPTIGDNHPAGPGRRGLLPVRPAPSRRSLRGLAAPYRHEMAVRVQPRARFLGHAARSSGRRGEDPGRVLARRRRVPPLRHHPRPHGRRPGRLVVHWGPHEWAADFTVVREAADYRRRPPRSPRHGGGARRPPAPEVRCRHILCVPHRIESARETLAVSRARGSVLVPRAQCCPDEAGVSLTQPIWARLVVQIVR